MSSEYRPNPLVSVVVPVYNVEEYLDECVDSIVSQTYPFLEIFLVDDGSPDHCPQKCDEWAARDNRIKVLHQHNNGLSGARNIGLELATGEYIMFIDSDDYIAADLVEAALKLIRETGSQICIFKHAIISGNGCQSDYPEGDRFPREVKGGPEDALKHLFSQDIHNYAWAHLAAKELYVRPEIQFPLGRSMEDLSTTYRLLGRATSVAYYGTPSYFYRKRSNSIVSKWTIKLSEDLLVAFEQMDSYISELYPDLVVDESNYKLKMLFYAWANTPASSGSNCDVDVWKRIANSIDTTASNLGFGKRTRINSIKLMLYKVGLLRQVYKTAVSG